MESIKYKFNTIKGDLKGQIDNDMMKISDNCTQY